MVRTMLSKANSARDGSSIQDPQESLGWALQPELCDVAPQQALWRRQVSAPGSACSALGTDASIDQRINGNRPAAAASGL